MARTRLVGFRLSAEEHGKLLRLAQQTDRSKSAVIRTLLRQARVGDAPDIRLGSPPAGEAVAHG